MEEGEFYGYKLVYNDMEDQDRPNHISCQLET